MNPLAIEALVGLGKELAAIFFQAKARLDALKADHPEVYAQIGADHQAAGAHLDAAAGP